MDIARHIHWNSLPEATRNRLIGVFAGGANPAPILSIRAAGTGGVAGWIIFGVIVLAAIVYMITVGYGSIWPSAAQQGVVFLFLYIGGFWLVAYCAFAAIRRVSLDRATPFRRGRYLLPTDVVVAMGPELVLYPLKHMTNLDPVHQHQNGVYVRTDFNFYFEGGHREGFSLFNKAQAEQALRYFDESGVILAQAAREQNWAAVQDLDVFFEARAEGFFGQDAPQDRPAPAGAVSGPAARTVPTILKWASIPALVIGLLAAPAWFVRNYMSEEASFRAAVRCGSTSCLDPHVGGRHNDEIINVHLPRAAFGEAQEAGTVTALRTFVLDYPQSQYVAQAREVIHGRFEDVRNNFNGQAATNDPNMLRFMGELLTWLEANDSPPVRVRFNAPTGAALAATDAAIQQEHSKRPGSRGVIPIAPHFTPELSEPRERSISTVLQRGFAPIFPEDVMSLRHHGRIPTDAPAEVANPTIDVIYEVAPSGAIYVDDTDGRQFVGITVGFLVRMSIPGSTTTHMFPLRVEPPQTFSVSYDRYGGAGGGPSEGAVYSTMASRAFEQLSTRLPMVFFRPDSPAYRQAVSGESRNRRPRPTLPGLPPNLGL